MAAGIVILGIDPGTERMGFGAVRAEGSRAAHVASGALVARGRSLAARLRSLEGALAERLSAIAPAAVALEEVFYHHNVRTAVRLGQGQAVALLAAARAGLEVATYAPAQVKLAVTGNGNARKEQVQAMVARILALAELPAPFDAADALAVALCHAHRVRLPRA